jgi:preprotein translocase subunit YajC
VDPIFIFFLVMLVFLYLLLIRPQRQQAKRHQEMLQNLAVGDEVITMGGIYGEVTDIDDERVQLEIDADVRIAVSRRAIASKVTAEESAAMAGEPEDAPEPMDAPEPASIDDVEPVAEEQARR